MATLPTQSFQTIVSNIVAGIQGRASKLINFAIGATLRAVAEGYAGILLWFQALVLQLLTATRLSTASGVDVDTFTADFMPTVGTSNGVASPRLGAIASVGKVTYSRFTAGPSSCLIPIGATSTTNDGSQTFAVTEDLTNPAFSVAQNGYVLSPNVASITVPVAATTAGASGNVQAGAISVMTSPIVGIDSVVNAAAFTNGVNQETDSALKVRFANYILGLSRGDYFGLQSAISGTNITVQWTLTEDYNFDGSVRYGYFFVVTDDGTGSPSSAFLTSVLSAANAVRPLGIQCQVFPPSITTANVVMQITTASGYDHNTVVAQVAALLKSNINGLGLGNPLEFGQLYSWAYSIPGVTNVTGVTLNGLTGDAASLSTTRTTLDGLSTINDHTIKAGTITVS